MLFSLLIIGAGQYGFLVKEIAESTGVYAKIDFLDDSNSIAVGKIDDLQNLVGKYSHVAVALGNPELRKKAFDCAKKNGYAIPAIISPRAYVSETAALAEGIVVEPMAVIQTGTRVGICTYISSGAVIRHNAKVGDFCHCDCNSVVLSSANVPDKTKIECLTAFK